MRFMRGTVGVAVALAVVCTVTAALWYAKLVGVGPHHPIFFYLVPIVLVAALYGSVLAILCAVGAILSAMFFLYDPVYSFNVANHLEWGDLICFALLAAIAVKCMMELLRPTARVSATRSRYGQP